MPIDETNKYLGKTWWELRPTMVYVPYPAWTEIKTFIIKVCKKKLVDCDERVSSWDRNIEVIDDNIKEKFKGTK